MKNYKILLITLIFSLLFFYLGNYSSKNENKNIKRFLLEREDSEKICSLANEKFKDKYKKMNYEKKREVVYSGNDEELINYLKDKNMETMYKYIKYLIFRYFIFIVADIILIFFWIFYCSCCCNPCCCCIGEKGCCSKTSYYISIIMYVGLIALGILGIIFGYPLKQNFVKSGCSFYKIFDHFKYGFGNDYEDSKEWIGIDNVSSIIQRSTFSSPISIDVIENFNNSINCSSFEIDYQNSCNVLLSGIDILDKILNNSKSDNILNDDKNNLEAFKEGLNEIEEKYVNESFTYLDNYIIKYSILNIFLFILVIIFGILGLFLLTCFAHKCECLKCFYIILWNIEALFMIIIVLLGICFGLIGIFSKNIISVTKYSTSSENLNSPNPIILNKTLILSYLDICINKGGDLSDILSLSGTPIGYFDDLFALREKVNENVEFLNKQNVHDNDFVELKNDLEGLSKIINNFYYIYKNYIKEQNGSVYDIFNCKFMKNDMDIFFDEVQENLIKTSNRLEIIIYVSALCCGISIMCGVIVINRTYYKNKKHKIKKNKENANNTQPEDGEDMNMSISSQRKNTIKEEKPNPKK